jgi:hypothetical protein
VTGAATAPSLDTGVVDPTAIFGELKYVIGKAIEEHPRSQQKAIGPSEIGSPCERRLAYKLLDIPVVNVQPPGWRPTVGTAVHSWLEDTFEARNVIDGFVERDTGRWRTERKLLVGVVNDVPIFGTCDLYDADTATSIDWKVVGPTTLRRVKAGHVSPGYQAQGQMYGRGWKLRGLPVHQVMVVFLPSAGELSEAQFWSAPFDEAQATAALERLARIHTLLGMVGERALPHLPIAEDYCSHCPWFSVGSTDPMTACPGPATLSATRSSPVDLLGPSLR